MIYKPPITEDFDLPWAPSSAPSIPDHEIISSIGRGSYGEVWLARSVLGTFRAIKIVHRARFETDRPFEREFSGMQKFEPISRSDDGLMPILQIGRNQDEGYFYYVMELADDAMDESRAPGLDQTPAPGRGIIDPPNYRPRTLTSEKARRGRLKAEECVQIGAALTLALDRLHKNGLIHRDIKPANIVFVKGVPKLADIGLVAEFSGASSYVGTEGFIPPEGPNSPQADIYSLGKVLYEVAMGKDRQDYPELCSDLAENPDRKLLVELNAIIVKACHPDRRHRYKSAREMHAELKLLQDGESVCGKRVRERRLRTMAWVAVAVSSLTLAALGLDRVLDWRVHALQGQSSLIKPALLGKIQPRDASTTRENIDLSRYYTAPLIEAWYPGPRENTLESMPKGIQSFSGITFDTRGLVQLSGQEISSYGSEAYPGHVQGIPIERWIKRLHFLEGALSEVMDGKQIGAYHIEYRSGRTIEIPIVYGRDLRALWQPSDSSGIVSNSVIAWTGENPPTRERNMVLRLYKQTWDNPQPDDEIIDLSFRSAMGNSAPFLVGLTCEEHVPPAAQNQTSANVIKTLQSQSSSFPQLRTTNVSGMCEFTRFRLKEHPIRIGAKYYDGIRFTTPPDVPTDLIWAFKSSTNLNFGGWYVVPTQGRIKVGFEDWYHGIAETARPATGTSDLTLQFLSGKKLQPGHDYFIWFCFDDAIPVEFEAAMQFSSPGIIDPNDAQTLVRAIGLDRQINEPRAKFHRHYCLGAVK